MNAGISDVRNVGVRVSPLLRNDGSYKRQKTVVVSHFDFDVGDMKCDRSDVLAELCKKFNMTSSVASTPISLREHLEMGRQDVKPLTATINSILYSKPSSFLDLTRNSKQCDTSRQQSWELAVSTRYGGELKEKCIVPKEGKPGYYGPSGPGSSLKSTEELRKALPLIFNKLGVKTFVDAPCGDWLWMQAVNLTGVQYFGGDITNVTVNKNRGCFGGAENVHFNWFDITCMIPPPVDLILVRDVLFHLPEPLVMEALANINESGARFLATTTFSDGENGKWRFNMAYQDTLGERKNQGLDSHIGFQKLNLYTSPFNFPAPVWRVDEDNQGQGRHVGVWKLPLQLQ